MQLFMLVTIDLVMILAASFDIVSWMLVFQLSLVINYFLVNFNLWTLIIAIIFEQAVVALE